MRAKLPFCIAPDIGRGDDDVVANRKCLYSRGGGCRRAIMVALGNGSSSDTTIGSPGKIRTKGTRAPDRDGTCSGCTRRIAMSTTAIVVVAGGSGRRHGNRSNSAL